MSVDTSEMSDTAANLLGSVQQISTYISELVDECREKGVDINCVSDMLYGEVDDAVQACFHMQDLIKENPCDEERVGHAFVEKVEVDGARLNLTITPISERQITFSNLELEQIEIIRI